LYRTALIMVVLVTAGLFPTGCGQQEQLQDTETTEETTSDTEETALEETTSGETIVEETTPRETATTAASDSRQVAQTEVEAAPPAREAAPPPPSNGESHPHDQPAQSQEPSANEAGQAISNAGEIAPANSIVFFPVQNGVTYSCTGGPPFVHHGHDASMGNCAVQHVGPPAGLVCDVPTTITIMHDIEQLVVDGNLCHSGTDAGLTGPDAALPDQAYPFDTEPAPYSPATYGGTHEH
jgi:hypothetical protein